MKLSKWAKSQDISYVTAYNWFKHGKLPVKAIQTATGTILVQEETLAQNQTTIYCKANSFKTVKECSDFCEASGWKATSITKEVTKNKNFRLVVDFE